MADKRITQIVTTYDRDDLALATDYLIVDRSGGSSARILAKEAVCAVLENTSDPIIIASSVNVDSGTLSVDASNNRVGVGTASPSHLLHLSSTDPRVRFEDSADGVIGDVGNCNNFITGGTAGDLGVRAAANLIFATGGTTERMRLNSSGNLGIGTASPSVKLQVAGAIAITDGMTAPSTVSGYAVLYVDSSGGDLKIKFGDGTVKTIVTDS